MIEIFIIAFILGIVSASILACLFMFDVLDKSYKKGFTDCEEIYKRVLEHKEEVIKSLKK